jgi:hypothetical protein
VNTAYDIEDNSFALLKFSGGAIATLSISYTVPDAFPCGRDLYLSVRNIPDLVIRPMSGAALSIAGKRALRLLVTRALSSTMQRGPRKAMVGLRQ